jgi:hypothetical protein
MCCSATFGPWLVDNRLGPNVRPVGPSRASSAPGLKFGRDRLKGLGLGVEEGDMAKSRFEIVLTSEERAELERVACYTLPYKVVQRARVVDNGSSQRGQKAVQRLEQRWPNLVLVHLPVHASWLNQLEICFSIVQTSPWSSASTA